MSVDGVAGATAQQDRQVTSSFNMLGKDDFFKMLVTQLKLQDPLSPMDNETMTTQMAQLSTVEQLTELKGHTGKLVSMLEGSMIQQSLQFAAGMLDKDVFAVDPESGGEIWGKAEGYQLIDGEILLEVEGFLVPASWVVRVSSMGGEG